MPSNRDRRVAAALVLGLLEAASGSGSADLQPSPASCSVTAVWDVVESPGAGKVPPAEPYEIEVSGPEPAIRVVARRGQPFEVAVPAGSSRWLRLLHPRLWSPSLEISAAECARTSLPLRLETRVAGALTGTILPEGPGAARTLEGPVRIDFRTAWAVRRLSSTEGFEGSSDCRTDVVARTFACLAPEGRWDLSIRAPGYVASRVNDALVASDRPLDVGIRTVRRGGALRGWVEKSDVEGGAAGVELRFDLRSVGQPTAALREEQEATAVRALSDARGGFAVTDLPPGSWVLEATAPGYAPALLSGLEVAPGQVLQLRDPVRLSRPFDFEVTIDPPLDPGGSPWRLRASVRDVRTGGLREEPAFAGAAPAGVARFPVSVGDTLYLRVADSAGNGLWFDPGFVVEDAEVRSLEVRIDLVAIAGRVTVADEPLAATLHFGGRAGAERVEVITDTEGRFAGTLPHAGDWEVEVVAPESSLETWTTVEVPEGGSGRLRIELPRTSVRGTVVDSTGQPVADARVLLRTPTSGVDARSGERGEFELRSFAPGFVTLFARHGVAERLRRSKPQELTVADDEAVDGVRLVLLDNDETTGRVVGPRGPVAGADLFVKVIQPIDLFHAVVTARTELDGTFRLELPQGSRRAVTTVLAPGHPLTAFEIDVPSESLLELPGDGGELVVRLRSPETRHHAAVVHQDDVELPFFLLARWAQSHGVANPRLDDSVRDLRFPALAPGTYRACWIDGALELERYLQEAALTPRPVRCRGGALVAGGRLELVLDSEGD